MYLDWKDDRFYYKDFIEENGLFNLTKTGNGSEVVKKDENVVFVEQSYISKVWTPNIYIFNAIQYKKHQLNKPVESLRIYEDGTIKMSKLMIRLLGHHRWLGEIQSKNGKISKKLKNFQSKAMVFIFFCLNI